MPAIWNINNSYNVNNNQKVASKLAFNVGEKFSGKIIKKGDGNEVSIKLTDGWEFSAEVDGDLDALEKGFARFQVEGFEDGKLKLKLVRKEVSSTDVGSSELKDIITKEGLSKKDIPLLEAMLKFDIPLSRENIKMVKGLVQFNDKIQGNPKEIENFIAKYLESKGIDQNSNKGQVITMKLQEFFSAFKSLSNEDVLLFLENNIEFTKENIESYNKLFKEQGKNSNVISEIKNELGNILNESESELLKLGNNIEGSKEVNQTTDGKNTNSQNGGNIKANENLASKLANSNVTINEKGIIENENNNSSVSEENTKTMKDNSGNINDVNSKKISGNNVENQSNKLATGAYEKNDFTQNKVSVLAVLKSIMGEGENQLNVELKDLLNSKRAEFTTKEFDKAYNTINKMDDTSFISMIEEAKVEYNNSPEKEQNSFSDYINKKKDDAKFGPGDLSFNKTELEKALSKALGKPVTVTDEQYNKIKDIVNLKLTEGENQGKTSNVDKMGGQPIAKDGALLTTTENVSDETVESNKASVNSKSDNAENLKALIKDKLTSQEVVKSIISSKGQEGKDIIKEIISSLKSESAVSEKILDVIKNNMSDVKLFNKISQEYYYLNVPVKIKEQEYPCKLILKDNRKDGKKIDSKNVKMVVTVKTANLGVVDGYIKVLENKIDIDLKCEKSFMKILDLGKEKLISNIKSLGFNISVNVSKKEDEVSLTSCRKFFNENNRVNLDIKV